MILKPGTLIADRYWILSHIGSGGMADVYHAQDKNLLRDIALKLLHSKHSQSPGFLERFHQEARAAANLNHPNLVTVFDFGTDGQTAYLVMEFIDGQDLKSYLRQEASLPVSEAVRLMLQICQGAGYAHRAGLIHCDLKPQNMLLTPDSRVKIADFGISRTLADINPDERADVIWGSPQYLAPEVASGGPPSAASDVYSLGVLLYEMTAGKLPFNSSEPEKLLEMHVTVPPPSPRLFNPDIPEVLEQIILKVLAKEPSSRYRTADQFGRILEAFKENNASAQETDHSQPGVQASASHGRTELFPAPSPAAGIDWLAVFLGLITFLAVGGLIPLWIWICLLYPSCPLGAP